MLAKRILILGGGSGGLVAAVRLRKLLGREHTVTLVDRSEYHVFAPSFLWLMLGERRREAIRKPLSALRRKGIDFHQADVLKIDPDTQTVTTSNGDLTYDYLVVALGAETAPEAMPGLAQGGHDLYDLEGSERLAESVRQFTGGRIVVLVSRLPFKCPAAPYEAALLLESYLADRGLRDKVEVEVHTPEALPMPTAGPAMGHAVASMLEARGVRFIAKHVASEIKAENKTILFEDGQAVSYDLLVTIPPHRSPSVISSSSLANEAGWIPVDPNSMQTRYPQVFAIGDNAAIKIGSGMMLPKAGGFAHDQAEIVAHNIATAVNGGHQIKQFTGSGYCFLEIGQGRAAFATGDFYAQPTPKLRMYNPGRLWHWGKVLFEKWWLYHWF